MKKFSRLLITLLIALTTVQIVPVAAKSVPDNVYPMEQKEKNYEVALVKDDGSFQWLASYDSFSEAKEYMKQSGDDAVVRAADSVKQTKIIAMNKGIAYSCEWENAGTVSLNSVSTSVSGYMSSYRQINYIDTETYRGSGHGNVRANIGGFECIVDLDVIELIPYKYIDKGIAIHLADDLKVIPKEACYTVVQNGNYKDLVYTAYTIFSKTGASAPLAISTAVGPAADWMVTGKKYYSVDDVNFYNDREMKDKAGVYYNYYQFLPLRTKCSISADTLNAYLNEVVGLKKSSLKGQGQIFIDAQNTYGMNALMIFAQACQETGYGKSNFAINRNNLFGWNAVDSDPNQADYYPSVSACVNQHMANNLRGYLNTSDWRYFGGHFGNKSNGISVKYASDPYYGLKISAIAYEIDKYANGYNGNLSEYCSNSIGLVTTFGASVYNQPSGDVLYRTDYSYGYQMNNTVSIIGETGDWYIVQSDNILENGKVVDVIKDPSFRTYEWNTCIGYMKKTDVLQLNTAKASSDLKPKPEVPEKPEEPETTLTLIGHITVAVDDLNIRTEPNRNSKSIGYVTNGENYPVYSITEAEGFTWYQIDVKQYVADTGEWLIYTPKTEGPSDTETSGPVDNKDAEINTFVTSVTGDSNEFTISGQGYLVGYDAITNDDISHKIEIVNLETDDVTTVDAQTSVSNVPDNMGDGYTYKAILYKAVINTTELPAGNYMLKLRISNAYVTNSVVIRTESRKVNIASNYNESTNLTTRLYLNNSSKNRMEISKECEGIDRTLIKKPTVRFSMTGYNKIDLTEDQLNVDGFGFIYESDMTESNNASFRLILVDENGNSYPIDLLTKKSPYDYDLLYDKGYTMDYADFEGSVNLAQLEAGTYRIYLDISNEQYRDISEFMNFGKKLNKSIELDGKTITLSTSKVHNRFILEVTE